MLDPTTKAVLTQHADKLRSLGATALFAFGSRNRGDHGPSSDLDLFIEYESDRIPSFFGVIEAELELQKTLGFPVHITTRNALHPKLRNRIETEASKIF